MFWFLRYSLRYRDIAELMHERGIEVDHWAIQRWVIKFTSELRIRKKVVGCSWRMDETYIKIKGVWHYLYRAVEQSNNTIDFLLTKRRDQSSAKRIYEKAIVTNGLPVTINIDKSGSNCSAIRTYKRKIKQTLRSDKLNISTILLNKIIGSLKEGSEEC